MLENEASYVPDWKAINAAHRVAAQAGFISVNSMPPGALGIDEVFSQTDDEFDTAKSDSIHDIPSKTNGFDGRSKTSRATPLEKPDIAPRGTSIAEQLTRLDELSTEVELEIANPKRKFFRTVETRNDDDRVYPERKIINDPLEQESLRLQEQIALRTVIDALRVDIFEKHPRTRGYPSKSRIHADETSFRNVSYLKSNSSEESRNRILQAILEDLESRLQQPPLTEKEKQRREWYGYTPVWQDQLYSPFLQYLR